MVRIHFNFDFIYIIHPLLNYGPSCALQRVYVNLVLRMAVMMTDVLLILTDVIGEGDYRCTYCGGAMVSDLCRRAQGKEIGSSGVMQ